MNYFTRTKDKRGLLTKFVLFMLLFLGSSGAWAQTYTKVTSMTELTTGDEYIFVHEDGTTAYAMGALNNGNMMAVKLETAIASNTVTVNTEDVKKFILGKTEVDKYTFNFSSTSDYLSCASSTKFGTSKTIENNSKWSINITDGQATIANVGQTGKIITGGTSNFKYQSKGTAPYLYKKTSGGSVTTPEINVTSDNPIEVTGAGGNQTIAYSITNGAGNVTATKSETVTWIKDITVAANAVTFTVDANTGEARSADITLSYEGAENVIVTVNQAKTTVVATPVINASNVEVAANATSGQITYTISNSVSGTELQATTTATWLTLGKPTAEAVPFTMDANTNTTTNEATVTLTYGTVTKDIIVTQAAAAAAGEETVPKPMLKTLTYSTTKGLFDKEETLSNGKGIPYYGAIAVNAAYADKATGAFVDMSDKVSGLVYKFDTKPYTKEEFKSHTIVGTTTVSTRSALITTEGRSESTLYLSVIAYHIKNGVRSYSDVATLKYKYEAPGNKKELTLKSSESPFTLELTAANKTSDEQGTLFNDVKTVTISATDADGNNVDLSGLSFISRSSNRKLALSHMTLDGTAETTDNGNTTLLMDKGRRAGVITVLIATPGNTDYLPAFLKVNIVLRDNTIGALATTPGTVYTSIADLRTAGRQNPKQPCVIEFNETNPATVVARFNYDDGSVGEPNTIFIVDNSGYGLRIGYSSGNKGKREQKFIDDYKLVPGTSFTGTIYANYNDLIASSSPSLRNFNLEEDGSVTINEKVYTTQITPDHSGEGIMENGEIIGANIPVTAIADVNTPNADRGDTSKDQISRAERPYVNTVVTIPGMIKKDENAKNEQDRYFLVQSKDHGVADKPNAIFLSAKQMPEINLDNYVGLEGVLTGLLTKRDDSSAKLTITRGSFFEADEVAEFVLDEQDVEGYVGKAFETGALTSERSVTVKIHRKGWTKDTWGTICLPFDLTAAEFKATFGQDITGLRQCKGTVSGNVLQFEDVADKNIKAGVPYLIKVADPNNMNGTADGKITAETKPENYYATVPAKKLFTAPVPTWIKVENINTVGKDIVGTTVEFRGLYGKKTYIDGSTTEKIAGDQRYQYISTKAGQPLCYLPTGSTNSFAGLRAYLFFPEWNADKNGEAQPTNTFLTLGLGDGTTTIGGIAADKATDGKVFNLAGQYVGNSADGLAKGIYIRNGKKFIVK